MTIAKLYKPEAVVSFSTETGEIVLRAKADQEGESIDDSVMSISTNNDISADAGTFQIQLSANKKWDEILASNDLVWIKMARGEPASSVSTVFVGLIDDVRKTVTVQGGTPQRSITVTGRSFAKALINFEVGTVSEMNMSLNTGWLLGRINFMKMSAADIVQAVLNELAFKFMNYEFSNGLTFQSTIRTKLSSRAGESLFDDNSFVNFQGSVWSFIREIINEPFNQVFWDCLEENDGKPTLIVRETPFNPDSWNALPIHHILDDEVVMDEVGRSDVETYTLFSVGPQSFFGSFDINKSTNVFPYWYEPYFKKFGLRRLSRFTNYVGFTSADDADQAEGLRQYQKDLYNWNIMNPIFFNGHLTVMGHQRYKVGDRLLYRSDEGAREIEFFIESVSHDFVNFGYWTTRLAVTRGLPEAGAKRFEEPWDTFTTYDATAMGSPGIPPEGAETVPVGTFELSNPTFPNLPGTAISTVIINYARSFIGKVSYGMGWGRSQNDIARNRFDCSSFVRYCFLNAGITLGTLKGITTDYLARQGRAASLSTIKPGDLIFFNTYKINGHVGIYIGNGEFIGAQSSGVNIQNVNYWIKKYGLGSVRALL